MRIALFGYGRMGKAIETVALSRDHVISHRLDRTTAKEPLKGSADVAIEFTRPEAAVGNIRHCLEEGVPVVVGTTGWSDRLDEVRDLVRTHQGSVIWGSNFSIGVNLFFRVNRLLAGLMDQRREYKVHIDEIHHIHKLDAPSGTAITLARDIDLQNQRYSGFALKTVGHSEETTDGAPGPVPIHSERTGEVPGKHAVSWTSACDRIIITHEAFDRSGFALGAVVAAEWLQGRRGLFTMDDVLGA